MKLETVAVCQKLQRVFNIFKTIIMSQLCVGGMPTSASHCLSLVPCHQHLQTSHSSGALCSEKYFSYKCSSILNQCMVSSQPLCFSWASPSLESTESHVWLTALFHTLSPASGMEGLHSQCLMNETLGKFCILTHEQVSQQSLPKADLPVQDCASGTPDLIC